MKAATGATMVRLLMRRGKGCFGVGGAPALVGTEASSPPGPRGWESRAPIVIEVIAFNGVLVLLIERRDAVRDGRR